jgi:hypothetical protein
MIIKTPIQELIFVLDFFNKVYKEDQDTINSEFTKFFIKHQEVLKYSEKYLIIDSFDAGLDIPPFYFLKYDGKKYFLENFNHE